MMINDVSLCSQKFKLNSLKFVTNIVRNDKLLKLFLIVYRKFNGANLIIQRGDF